jgi:polar amino acid transport system substrate-binding protein
MKRAVVGLLVLGVGLLSSCATQSDYLMAPKAYPVIDRIQQRGELAVGMTGEMPPLNMTTRDGMIIGLEVDLARRMAQAMGVDLRLQQIAFPDLLPALQAGKVDMVLSGMTMTPQRNMRAAFVGPYFVSGKSFLTKTKALLSVTEPGQMNNPDTVLTALQDSTSQAFVEKLIPEAELVTVPSYEQGVQMVIQDEADALVADYPICVVSVFRYPEAELSFLLTPLSYEPIGIAIPSNDPLLMNWVTNFLNTLEDSGVLEDLTEKWFEDGSWLKELK